MEAIDPNLRLGMTKEDVAVNKEMYQCLVGISISKRTHLQVAHWEL